MNFGRQLVSRLFFYKAVDAREFIKNRVLE